MPETAPPPLDANEPLAAAVAAEREAQVAFLAELVKVPSDNPPGDCAAHGERAAALLEGLGWTVERHPVAPALCAANGMRSATNLIVRRRFGPAGEAPEGEAPEGEAEGENGGPVIALNAHGDVVPPGEGWTKDPYGAEIVDGRMYGRGVAVSKSDFATYAFALRALERAGLALRGTVELHLTYDEEAGGEIGPALILREGLSRPDLAVCASFSYAVTVAHAGCLHLEVTLHGKQAHAAMPQTGVDALEAATEVLRDLYAERARLRGVVSATPGLGSAAVTVGLISGGVNTNVVPDKVVMRLDRRMIPEENPSEVEAGLRALIETAAARIPGARVEIRRILLARALVPTEASLALAERFTREASAVFGTEVRTTGVPLYTDARHYAEAGIPTVLYGAGPRTILEANAHRADENVPLDDLHRATVVVARVLAEVLAA
ncbi:M20/M25/M40 family metallo-hydrolase [Roseomonas sp. NAR14]|uniref:M20/M25/M40 family metallo-hydrolase n=1 Tax=Roseomonas acroporae TaxID=2937791 RepID=A0A9X2BWH6_9PROT|nr:M20/M25/M40 family metallo-hydrolase [Roseomonas acroporae]MCK8787692.1 M20/M25/M40 family metallo-hydrolase [Roseomonas acroporae]